MSAVTQRRGAKIDEAVLAATLELLDAHGFDFAIEDVAARADVHKTTIYRRWITKPALIAFALTRLSEETVVAEPTDDPLADLELLAVRVAAALALPVGRNPLVASLAAAGSDPALAHTVRAFFHSRYQAAAVLIESAQTRGLIAPDLDPVMIWQAIVNPMHLDTLCGVDTTPERARALVGLALNGARPRDGGRS